MQRVDFTESVMLICGRIREMIECELGKNSTDSRKGKEPRIRCLPRNHSCLQYIYIVFVCACVRLSGIRVSVCYPRFIQFALSC